MRASRPTQTQRKWRPQTCKKQSKKPEVTESDPRKTAMARSFANAERLAKLETSDYKGPYISGISPERKFMQKISNMAHSSSSNNGYARKQSGGFYFH